MKHEAFEQWAVSAGWPIDKGEDGEYIDVDAWAVWEAWRAAGAAGASRAMEAVAVGLAYVGRDGRYGAGATSALASLPAGEYQLYTSPGAALSRPDGWTISGSAGGLIAIEHPLHGSTIVRPTPETGRRMPEKMLYQLALALMDGTGPGAVPAGDPGAPGRWPRMPSVPPPKGESYD